MKKLTSLPRHHAMLSMRDYKCNFLYTTTNTIAALSRHRETSFTHEHFDESQARLSCWTTCTIASLHWHQDHCLRASVLLQNSTPPPNFLHNHLTASTRRELFRAKARLQKSIALHQAGLATRLLFFLDTQRDSSRTNMFVNLASSNLHRTTHMTASLLPELPFGSDTPSPCVDPVGK